MVGYGLVWAQPEWFDSFVAPAYLYAQLIRPPDPDTDLAAEPDALWVEAFTNPVYFRVKPLG